MQLASGIIVTHSPLDVIAQLEALRTMELFTYIQSEDSKGNPKEFLVEHAQEAIEKAYIASEVLNYIILVAPRFSEIAQNRLLKIIEEPPRNKAFILITESKSALLLTIQSRLPVTVLKNTQVKSHLDLDMRTLNLNHVYEFIQKNSRISTVECKILVENIFLETMRSQKYTLDEATLTLFSNSIKALEVGSPATFILNTLLLKLLSQKKI